ncbi:MAG: polyprenyl synthetase family protein [Alicyclobacillaceae bacterium]|nr:polyprenyl synthetase family protein [Alicyclobacillaceae bacterium]
MNYSLLAGGKRLRPVLCLATAASFGADEEAVLPAAAALEVLHCYSLIHDDLPAIDNDDMRRGKPTNHKVFGEATALLAGDALLTYAFELLSQPLGIPAERQLEMVRVLSRAAGCYGMVGGQMEDILAERSGGSLDDLQFIHTHKTAKLIQASVVIGAVFAGVPAPVRAALERYGLEVGLAFQMVDDLLDVTGTTEELGKTAGSDERLQKLTYPALVGVEETRRLCHEAVERGLSALAEAGIEAPLLAGMARFIVARRH